MRMGQVHALLGAIPAFLSGTELHLHQVAIKAQRTPKTRPSSHKLGGVGQDRRQARKHRAIQRARRLGHY